jgi:hypothetical protein
VPLRKVAAKYPHRARGAPFRPLQGWALSSSAERLRLSRSHDALPVVRAAPLQRLLKGHHGAAPEVIRTCSGELVPRACCRDSLSFPIVMRWPTTGSVRLLASRTLFVLLTLISTLDAAETNVCTVAANPSGFDHRQVTLKGIVAGLSKSTSRSGHKQMTVEGIFEMERRRDGSTFHNEMQAMKITTMPR